MQTTKMRLHRRDFLKASTAASTATAFGAFALAGNGAAIAATQATDKSGSMMVAQASMTEGDIAALPRFKLDLVAPPFVPKHDQVASGGPKVVEVTMTAKEMRWTVDDGGAEIWASTFDGSIPRSADRLPSGRLHRVDAQEPGGKLDGAQYRFPRIHGRTGRWRADAHRSR